VRMSLIPPPHIEGYATYLAVMQMADGPERRTVAPGEDPVQLPALQLLKSLDDLDEEADEDDDEVEDLDDDDEEDEEDDLEDDYDEDEDEDEDEDDEDEDDDEDGGVKPLKMAPPSFGAFRT